MLSDCSVVARLGARNLRDHLSQNTHLNAVLNTIASTKSQKNYWQISTHLNIIR